MLNSCIDKSDASVFVLVERIANKLNYVVRIDSDTLILCHEIKSANWFMTEEEARNARDTLFKYWYTDSPFRVAKYYFSKEVLCLL